MAFFEHASEPDIEEVDVWSDRVAEFKALR
jgi:hypothetical protein